MTIRLLRLIFTLAALAFSPSLAFAQSANLSGLVDALAPGSFSDREAAMNALVATGDEHVPTILQALTDGDLYARKSDAKVVIARKSSGVYALTDPLDGTDLGTAAGSDIDKVKTNNNLRSGIRTAIGRMTLLSPNPAMRLVAAQSVLKNANPDMMDLLDQALAAESDAEIRETMELARAVMVLKSDTSLEDKRAAVGLIASKGDRDAQTVLVNQLDGAPDDLKPVIQTGIDAIGRSLAIWDVGQNLIYGISQSSVLLLAAIGLAITFGVMGIINMAHGEMVMLGAYVTFVVQEILRNFAPGLLDYSLAIAVPAAFLFTGLVGIAVERSIIRWLYGRPLETLLATWGLSLILQQSVRTIFGANNKLVSPPSWMTGAFDLGGLTITWNRLWIVVFAMAVFLVLQIVLNRTALGLQMRAVTQNRRMASSMGIRTPFVDAMTFGLGSGIAGMAGVALSQIDNVSPNLGQGYIIDSFMVVVFGGVGNLWGTLIGALTLGVSNKILEPLTGAVLGKIIILVLIILFIQRRPRGLFALKGRAIEQ
ncbi:MAG: urea ABC transporter permease subunit UrtB [Devosia sp.]